MSVQAITTQTPVALPSATNAASPSGGRPQVGVEDKLQPAARSVTEQKQELEAAVKAVKDFTRPMTGNLEFTLDDQTGITVIKVTDATTNELIRQIPSEEMLEIARALDKIKGLLVYQKA